VDSHAEPNGPASETDSTWRRRAHNLIEAQIARYPFLVQMRSVWRLLQDERENWSLLLPVLALFFIIVYRRERKSVRALIKDLAD
jgi:hypothetical protein